jgi:DNA-binding GntR family transcriptional regulator
MAFTPSVRPPGVFKWAHVADDVRGAIEAGLLQKGERIPTENQLCTLYGYSSTPVRRARAHLAQLEVIELRHPFGAFVTWRP